LQNGFFEVKLPLTQDQIQQILRNSKDPEGGGSRTRDYLDEATHISRTRYWPPDVDTTITSFRNGLEEYPDYLHSDIRVLQYDSPLDEIAGVTLLPPELTSADALDELGYSWKRVEDPDNGDEAEVPESFL
jgi:hypothetical protein